MKLVLVRFGVGDELLEIVGGEIQARHQQKRLLDDQNSSFVSNAGNKIDAQATADRVSETPTLFIGKTGSKLKPVSSTVTFDAAQLAAAIRALG